MTKSKLLIAAIIILPGWWGWNLFHHPWIPEYRQCKISLCVPLE